MNMEKARFACSAVACHEILEFEWDRDGGRYPMEMIPDYGWVSRESGYSTYEQYSDGRTVQRRATAAFCPRHLYPGSEFGLDWNFEASDNPPLRESSPQ